MENHENRREARMTQAGMRRAERNIREVTWERVQAVQLKRLIQLLLQAKVSVCTRCGVAEAACLMPMLYCTACFNGSDR